MSVILGINAMHAGASAALVVDGKPVIAIAEERFNRVKHYAAFPKLAIQRCLDAGGLHWRDIDAVAIGRDASANRAQKLRHVASHPTRLLNLVKIRAARTSMDTVREIVARECEVDPANLRFEQHDVEHHLAHTASAYFASDWDSAAGISIDGSGDFVSCMMSRCEGDRIQPVHRIFVPHSLGSLYTVICSFIGYDKYGDEGKVMGLAPLGCDRYREELADMVAATRDGFKLNPDWFVPFGANQGIHINPQGEMEVERHFSDKMIERFGAPRERHAEITERDADLAYSLQQRFEQIYLHLLERLHERVPSERLVMAGGCALNSVANGMIFGSTPFRATEIQPAAGDDGLALGSALYVSRSVLGERERWRMNDAFLGTGYSEAEMRAALDERNVGYQRLERERLLAETADEIAAGQVVGWFQGRMEWGPRALGNRSILAHPGLPNMKEVLNARIKHREPFRPFAPSVRAERQDEIFERSEPSPYMLHVYKIRPEWRERLCAVNHVDDTGRLQTVAREANPLYHDLIGAFEQRSGLPVVLNTSFNENEPIVENPAQAIDCFLRTRMDVLALGPFLCRKPDVARDS
jgi:carbamoyltransferase